MKNVKIDYSSFCNELSLILKSGISLRGGLDAILNQSEDEEEKKILIELTGLMDQGNTFAQSLTSMGLFDSYLIGMVEVGERSGYLDSVMEQLAIYYQRMDDTEEKLKDALTYPLILMFMMVAVLVILVGKVLPMFQQVLNNLGTDLAPIALGIMKMGDLLAKAGFVILVLVILVIVSGFMKVKKSNGDFITFLSGLPFTKKVLNDLAVAKFAFAMSLLMNSGVDLIDSLKMIPKMINNSEVKGKINVIESKMNEGNSFAQSVAESKIFKAVYSRLLSIGFESGQAEKTMATIASKYEDEVDSSINRFLNLIEPSIVALLSVLVGIILLSVMLPLMSIMASL